MIRRCATGIPKSAAAVSTHQRLRGGHRFPADPAPGTARPTPTWTWGRWNWWRPPKPHRRASDRDAALATGSRQAFGQTRAPLIARVPGRPNRAHFPEDFHIDLAGSCHLSGGAGYPTWCLPTAHSAKRVDFLALLPIRRGGPAPMPPAVPVVAAKPGTGRTVQLHLQEALYSRPASQQSEAAEYRQRRVWTRLEPAGPLGILSPATSAVPKPGSSCTWQALRPT